MNYLRQTVDTDKLVSIFDIPEQFNSKKAEVIILAIDKDEPTEKKTKKSSFGSLHEYAEPALSNLEKGAWERAAAAKYANS
ncbi:MAG: hypothetical protein LBV16_03005 [Elusimicrobiota bacterium]|jgi:hypothetical protein|nr:hypothetical protein [Elusimicrobiota bacterium]